MTRRLSAAALIALAALAAALIGVRVIADTADADAVREHRFNLLEYELTHLPNRWLMQIAEWFDGGSEDEAAILDRWFDAQPPADRNRVERIVERRLTAAIHAAGLATPLPLFEHQRIVWPPVDVEFDDPLHLLAVSPRGEIQLIRSVLFDPQLPIEAFAEIEAAVEADGEYSAVVLRIGGVAAYPALIVTTRSYEALLHLAAHEWTHHYLAFYPLGQAYARSSAMRTINETVSDIAADELAGIAAAQHPRDASPAGAAHSAEWEAIRARTDPILRALRLEVDALLEAGAVEEAEALMERTRLELAAQGRTFRRINQAFFSFRGAYGANPAAVTPWGERLITLRAQAGSLADFLRLVRAVSTDDGAERLLIP